MASPLYCELSVAKTQATEFLFHASESAFALQTRNLVLSPGLGARNGEIPVASGMSALGQKQTCATQNGMSALPPKADICSAQADVR